MPLREATSSRRLSAYSVDSNMGPGCSSRLARRRSSFSLACVTDHQRRHQMSLDECSVVALSSKEVSV
ncbi:hypothetical protein HYC85_028609 [Camellia sinensis]|uniref:Uncharacterized protein n=1 Tax=Camellia sinensis TaxID=4442 RepID=A0A7J7FXU3_CAMSI|nr:hypothetical protein HYC85_028609 [Camellia sinensis]